MLTIVKSERHQDQIIHADNIFEKKRITNAGIIWRCVIKTCKCQAISCLDYLYNLSSFTLTSDHNHQPQTLKATRKVYIETMRQKIISSNESPRNIAYSVIRGASRNIIEALGSFDTIYRYLRRYRENFINPRPYVNENLKLSEALCTTHTKESFYQYGIGNYKGLEVNADILIFFSNSMAQNLKNNSIWCVDGTFAVVPTPYMQLFTVSYIVDHHVFPCVFGILKNKKQNTYLSFFRI